MHRFEGYQSSRTFLIDLSELLKKFETIAAGESHQVEIERPGVLEIEFKRCRTTP